ncbi:MAG TPA: sugar nucleotide-binding protein, partial [Jatrophihabitans sp.]
MSEHRSEPKRWLITGSKGQLGTDLQKALALTPDDVVHAIDIDELDITDSAAVQATVTDFGPDVIVNAAAYTAVDKAEADEETAYQANATGPAVLAAAAARAGIPLIHVST